MSMKIVVITVIALLVIWSMLRPAEINEPVDQTLEDAD